MSTQYLVSYLAALRSLVLKLRECKRDAENIYVIFEFVAGILSYGTVFGNIHSILELMDSTAAVNQAEEYHNFEMEGIISFMKEKKLRPELQQMVRDYKELQWQKSKGLDEDHFFVGIPKSVQQEIKNFLYLELVQKVPIFQNTDAYFQQILAFKIRPMHVLNGWTIFRKGDEGEEMFFIKSGKVEICSEDGTIIFVTLTAGAFFGEIALFESCHRTATARAKGNCELCTLSKEEFNILMNLYPSVAEGIRETIRLRKIQEEEKKKKAEEEAERLRMEEEDKVDDGDGGGGGGSGGGNRGHPKRSILKLNGAGAGGRRQSAMFGSRRGSMLASFGVVKEPDTQDIDKMLVSVAPMSVDRLPRSNSERKRSMVQTGGRRISFAEFKSPSS
ncbi:UNVERIFIED_CONTAM: Kinesin-like protein kif27 [Siphonaria sp. JEL0065]|nr:Kinesin-like protein kif27 [Siphonaria sp. JEL0065]